MSQHRLLETKLNYSHLIPRIHFHIQVPLVNSNHIYTCKPTKWCTLSNWLRIRAHGVLWNLWRLCIMLESVEIRQPRHIMPAFLWLLLYYFPVCALVTIPLISFFSPFPRLCFIIFSLPSQFPSVVLHLLLLSFTLPFQSVFSTPLPLLAFSPSLGPLAVSPQVMFSWPDDACISLVSSWC